MDLLYLSSVFWTIILLYLQGYECGSYFRNADVPKFTMEGEGKDQFVLRWQQQAISTLMAIEASKLQKHLTDGQRRNFEKCCQKSNDFNMYAVCFKTVWKKGKQARQAVKRKRFKRDSTFQQRNDVQVARMQMETVMRIQAQRQQEQEMMQRQRQMLQQQQAVLAQQRSPLGHLVDWLTGFVQTMKEPKVISDGKFLRDQPDRMKFDAMPKLTKYENPLTNTLLGEYIKKIFQPVNGLSDLIVGCDTTTQVDNRADFKTVVRSFIQESKYSRDSPIRQRRPSWQNDFIRDAQNVVLEMSDIPDDPTNEYILSPRFFPLSPQQPGNRFLSPDVLTFQENNPDALGSIPNLLENIFQPGDKNAFMNLLMEISGTSDALSSGRQKQRKIQQQDQGVQTVDFQKVYGESYGKYHDTFKQFYSMISPDQLDRMSMDGYAFLTPDQLDVVYNNRTVFGPAPFNVTAYKRLATDEDRRGALLDYFVWLTDQAHANLTARHKRSVILTPLVLAPVVLTPLVLMPIILSPLVLSPVVLSPIVIGPIILSPLVFSPLVLSPALFAPLILSPDVGSPIVLSPLLFSPVILSPLVLGGIVLSPLIGDVLILSPLVLFPIVLSPLLLNPLILSPFVLTPIVLSPVVLSPLILDPHVLSPIVLSPILLSPIILSPGVLSPVVLSPIVGSPIIRATRFLSPEVLSPNIQSPKRFYTSFGSPSILSRRKRAQETSVNNRSLVYVNWLNAKSSDLGTNKFHYI